MTDPHLFSVGNATWTIDVPAEKRVPVLRPDHSSPTATPRELLRQSLESLIGFGVPLRRAVTPDDRVAVVLDERLPHLGELLCELLAQLQSGGIPGTAITVIVPHSQSQPWIDDLPDELDDLNVEVHDPTDVKKLAFLGTSAGGRKVYLNRTLVEADFVVVLTGRRFGPWGGCDGAEGAIFPSLSNAETLGGVSTIASRKEEAEEVAGRLGTPVFVQVIEGPADSIAEVIAGVGSASRDGARRQKANWGCRLAEKADLVVVGVGGSDRVGETEFATAVANGRKCLADGGRLVILTDASDKVVSLSPAWGDPDRVFVGSAWGEETLENLGVIPLGSDRELARLVAAAERVIVLPDAYKMKVRVN